MEKRKYKVLFHPGAKPLVENFMDILTKKIGKKKSLAAINYRNHLYYNYKKYGSIIGLLNCDKILSAIPNLKIKVTNKLTKEELFFDSFRDVIIMIRKEYKSRYGTFAESFRTEELLNKTFASLNSYRHLFQVKKVYKHCSIHSILMLLEIINYDCEIILID